MNLSEQQMVVIGLGCTVLNFSAILHLTEVL